MCWKFGLGLVIYALMIVPLHADDSQDDIFKFSGFGTLGVAHSSEERADLASQTTQATGTGHTRRWDANVDSKLGVQLDAMFSPQWSAVAQVVAEQRYDNSYRPYFNVANIKWQLSPNFGVRVGRIPLSTFMIANYRMLGYSQPWVRPPLENYFTNIMTHYDGVGMAYRMTLGDDWDVVARGALGSWHGNLHDGGLDIDRVWGGSLTAVSGASSYHLSYFHDKATLTSAALDQAMGVVRLFGANALADKYQAKGDANASMTLGWSYDPGRWFLMAEVNKVMGKGATIANSTAGYVTAGLRIENWAPYVTLAGKKMDSEVSYPVTSVPTAIINGILNTRNSAQRSIALGVRWDFMKNTDFKAEWLHVNPDTNSNSTLINVQTASGVLPGDSYNVVTAVVDFVF